METISHIKTTFIKADNNIIINEKYIRWVKKMDDCFEVCSKPLGCALNSGDTHKICKINNPNSFNILNKFFQ